MPTMALSFIALGTDELAAVNADDLSWFTVLEALLADAVRKAIDNHTFLNTHAYRRL